MVGTSLTRLCPPYDLPSRKSVAPCPPSVWVQTKARQNSLGQHPIGRHALVAPIVIAGCDDDQQIEPWKDIKSLAAIADGGDPALLARSVRAIEHHFTEIPVTTIFAPVAHRHLRLERFF